MGRSASEEGGIMSASESHMSVLRIPQTVGVGISEPEGGRVESATLWLPLSWICFRLQSRMLLPFALLLPSVCSCPDAECLWLRLQRREEFSACLWYSR